MNTLKIILHTAFLLFFVANSCNDKKKEGSTVPGTEHHGGIDQHTAPRDNGTDKNGTVFISQQKSDSITRSKQQDSL
ncbi:MAG: hypothetical protein ACPGQR_08360 [Marinirhabdus sp.]